jgi:hypothetical protein
MIIMMNACYIEVDNDELDHLEQSGAKFIMLDKNLKQMGDEINEER